MLTTILLAQPRGFCAGVDRAIEIVERALAKYGAPIYVRHEIVHNQWVVEDLTRKGVVFVEEVDEVPEGGVEAATPVIVKTMEAAASPAVNLTVPIKVDAHAAHNWDEAH